MADFGFNTNISLGATVPRTSLSDMVNMASGITNLQQAQQLQPVQLEAARLQLQQAQQMNPLLLRSQQAETQVAESIARPRITQAEQTAETARIATLKSQLGLDDAQAQIAYSQGGALLGDPRIHNAAKKVDDAIDAIEDARDRMVASGVPRAKASAIIAPFILKAQNSPQTLVQDLTNAVQGASGGAAIAAQVNRAPTQVGVGSRVELRPTSPLQLGQQQQSVEMELPPTALETPTGGVNPITGLPQVIVKNALGRTTGFRDVQPGATTPTGPITPTVPIGESAETGKVYQGEIIAARAAATPAKVALNNIDTVLKYLPLAATGKFSEAQQGIQSVLGSVSGNNAAELAASARDIISKTIEDLALNKNAALGGKFASDLAAVQKSIASAERNPTAIRSSMEQLRPLLQHAYNYSQGLDKAVSKNPTAQYVKPQFDAAMNEAFDMKALMMLNAYQSGSTDGLKKWTAANKVTVPEQQKLFGQLERYKALVDGDLGRYNTLAGAR